MRQTQNLDVFYLNNVTSMEEILFVDQVSIEDDTSNYFLRKAPKIIAKGIAKN